MSPRNRTFVAALLLIAAARPGAAIEFQFAPAFDTGQAPYEIGLADMDGDGDLDAVTVDLQDQEVGTVSVALNDGTGAFGPPASYPVGAGSAWIAVGDVNGDGRPEVAVSNSQAEGTGAVTLYRNNGNGGLVAPLTLTAPEASYPHGIAIGDWNGDGKADVAVALMMAARVKVFWGNGTGGFPTSVSSPDLGTSPMDLATADFDGDGKLDLVVTDVDGARLLYGTGTGFTLGAYLDNFPDQCDHVVTGDFDENGHPDFATTGRSLTLFLNDGTGQGWERRFSPVGENPVGIAAGDLDLDGHLDVAAALYLGGAISLYHGDGDGNFPVRRDWGVGLAPNELAIGDVDGDGLPDMVAPSSQLSQTDFQVVRNLGGRRFHARRDYDVVGDAQGLAVADFDHDGDRDLVVAVAQSNADKLKILRSNGDGTMQDPVTVETFGNNMPTNVIVADFDENGWMDAAASIFSPGNDLRVWLNDGAGNLLPSTAYPAGGNPGSLAAGDLDRDGNLDVVVVNSALTDNTISIFRGVGNGTFLPHTQESTLLRPSDVALADFDRDTDLDVLVTHSMSTSILLFENDGFGGLTPTAISLGVAQSTPNVADLDGDGWLDVALTTGTASFLFNDHQGGFTFVPGSVTASGGVGMADFDLDGDADLIATNFFESLASVMVNDGTGQFAVEVVVPVGYLPGRSTGADVGSDGLPEILTANSRAGSISVVTQLATNAIFVDGVESGDTSAWSLVEPQP